MAASQRSIIGLWPKSFALLNCCRLAPVGLGAIAGGIYPMMDWTEAWTIAVWI
jgi:hypothetical protein